MTDELLRAAYGAMCSHKPGNSDLLRAASHALRSYQHGNASPDLAKDIADRIDAALAPRRCTHVNLNHTGKKCMDCGSWVVVKP